jgi:hypothetical protein
MSDHTVDHDARRTACDGSRYCAAQAHWHGCFAENDPFLTAYVAGV